MKPKHNKKRNTSFLFEALVRVLTRSVIRENTQAVTSIKKILREYFSHSTVLSKDLECYNALLHSRGLDKYTAEKMIFRAKRERESLGDEEIFKSQSQLIRQINESIGPTVYGTFVPNYKALATIAQLFTGSPSIQDRILLEQQIVENMMGEETISEPMKPQDDLVISTFQKNFNDRYGVLLPEQKDVLRHYVLSFGDEEAHFKVYMATTLGKIKEEVEKSLSCPEVAEDATMVENTHLLLKRIDTYDVNSLSHDDILKVVKMQQLVREYQRNAT
jgi:hypothetical protein